ncbi:MAG: hypothetical protein WDO72_19905 [Pseudomonadota bacterium]
MQTNETEVRDLTPAELARGEKLVELADLHTRIRALSDELHPAEPDDRTPEEKAAEAAAETYRDNLTELESQANALLAFVEEARLYQSVLPASVQAEVARAVEVLSYELSGEVGVGEVNLMTLQDLVEPVSLHLTYNGSKQ